MSWGTFQSDSEILRILPVGLIKIFKLEINVDPISKDSKIPIRLHNGKVALEEPISILFYCMCQRKFTN